MSEVFLHARTRAPKRLRTRGPFSRYRTGFMVHIQLLRVGGWHQGHSGAWATIVRYILATRTNLQIQSREADSCLQWACGWGGVPQPTVPKMYPEKHRLANRRTGQARASCLVRGAREHSCEHLLDPHSPLLSRLLPARAKPSVSFARTEALAESGPLLLAMPPPPC